MASTLPPIGAMGLLALSVLGCGPATPVAADPVANSPSQGSAGGAAAESVEASASAITTATSAPTVSALGRPIHPGEAACETGDAKACLAAGGAYLHGRGNIIPDAELALSLLDKACGGKQAEGCFEVGNMLLRGDRVPRDEPRGAGYLGQSCQYGYAKGCRIYGRMLLAGRSGAAQDQAAGHLALERACQLGEARGCFFAGETYLNGVGVSADRDKARARFEAGCAANHRDSCHAVQQLAASQAPGVQGANLSMQNASADGLTLKDLSCRIEGLGLFGGIAVVASLSKKKTAFDSCAPAGADMTIQWSAQQGRVGSASAAGGSPATNQCVTRVLKSITLLGTQSCAASLHIGK